MNAHEQYNYCKQRQAVLEAYIFLLEEGPHKQEMKETVTIWNNLAQTWAAIAQQEEFENVS